MTPAEYRAARAALGWTHKQIGAALGIRLRTSFRYANGASKIPESTSWRLRHLVRKHLTSSERNFDEVIGEQP